ncbi:MAG: RloB domain-containing protein [Vulcanimicrobiaceae bacterium]
MRTNKISVIRPQRARVFVGCEGDSEQAYTVFLSRLLEEIRKDRHLDAAVLKGGDPLSRIEYAVKIYKKREANRGQYMLKTVLLDRDVVGIDPKRDELFDALVSAHNFIVLWLEPCIEGFLLRHFPGCEKARPNTATQALGALRGQWAHYEKPPTTVELASKFARGDVVRAASVEPNLCRFLDEIGFI